MRMIYWAIISFRPQLSGTGQQTSLVNYICGARRKSFLSRMHDFPVSREAALLSSQFQFFSVPWSVPFSGLAHSTLVRGAYRTCHSVIISNPWIFAQILPPFSHPLLFLPTSPSLDRLLPEQTWPSCAAASPLSPPPAMLSSLPHLQICCKREIFWALLH